MISCFVLSACNKLDMFRLDFLQQVLTGLLNSYTIHWKSPRESTMDEYLAYEKTLDDLMTCSICQRKVTNWLKREDKVVCPYCKPERCPKCLQFYIYLPNIKRRVLRDRPCKYTDKGCTKLSILWRHEIHCNFRPTKCPILMVQGKEEKPCFWEGCAQALPEHLNKYHKSYSVAFDNTKDPEKTVVYRKFWNLWIKRCYHWCIDGHIFFLTSFRSGHDIYHSVRPIYLYRPNNIYYFTLTFKTGGDDILYKYKIMAKPFSDDFTLKYDYCDCASVPVVAVMNNDGDVIVHVKISVELIQHCSCHKRAESPPGPRPVSPRTGFGVSPPWHPPRRITTQFLMDEDLPPQPTP